jgi:hypothetical protein
VNDALATELLDWWRKEREDWDILLEPSPDELTDVESDLWDSLPVVDSKAIARSAPIFEAHLGIPLDVKLIRPGGYPSIEAAIEHLLPRMEEKAAALSLATVGGSL